MVYWSNSQMMEGRCPQRPISSQVSGDDWIPPLKVSEPAYAGG